MYVPHSAFVMHDGQYCHSSFLWTQTDPRSCLYSSEHLPWPRPWFWPWPCLYYRIIDLEKTSLNRESLNFQFILTLRRLWWKSWNYGNNELINGVIIRFHLILLKLIDLCKFVQFRIVKIFRKENKCFCCRLLVRSEPWKLFAFCVFSQTLFASTELNSLISSLNILSFRVHRVPPRLMNFYVIKCMSNLYSYFIKCTNFPKY